MRWGLHCTSRTSWLSMRFRSSLRGRQLYPHCSPRRILPRLPKIVNEPICGSAGIGSYSAIKQVDPFSPCWIILGVPYVKIPGRSANGLQMETVSRDIPRISRITPPKAGVALCIRTIVMPGFSTTHRYPALRPGVVQLPLLPLSPIQ